MGLGAGAFAVIGGTVGIVGFLTHADHGDDWTKDGPGRVAQPRLPLGREVYTASRPALSGLFGRSRPAFPRKAPSGRVRALRLSHFAPIARCHSSASVPINSASAARV
ncbi:MAG: hypothetical protein QOD10_5984 [Mycobacterium sp.]|nr:hypothetical protein [Mycobacterium sp.]